jgi:ATP-binding cassette subfamily F protein 3
MRREAVAEDAGSVSRSEQRRANTRKRQNLKPLKDKIDAAESQITALNTEIAKLDKTLADPLLFTNDPAKGSAVSKKRADAVRKLEAAEKNWMAAQEEYDAAMAAD